MKNPKDTDLLRFIYCLGGHSVGAISGSGSERSLRMHTDNPGMAWDAVRGLEEAVVYVLGPDGWEEYPDPRNKKSDI